MFLKGTEGELQEDYSVFSAFFSLSHGKFIAELLAGTFPSTYAIPAYS